MRSVALLVASVVLGWPLLGVAEQVRSAEPGSGTLTQQLNLANPGSEIESEALERLERAIEEWDDGDPVYGARLADSALALLPALSDWRPLVFAELLSVTGDTANVRTALEQMDPRSEFWSRWGWTVLADAYEAADDLMGAGEAARARARLERSPEAASAAWFRAGRVALEVGDSLVAKDDLWEALAYGASFEGAREAAALIDRVRWPLDGADELRIGRALLASRSWDRAHARLAPYVDGSRTPAPTDRDSLRLELGRALIELRRFPAAEAMLSPLTGDDTASELRSPALYWTGRALLGRGVITEAESTFRRLAVEDEASSWAEQGMALLLTRELETGFGPRAQGFLGELLQVGVGRASVGTTVVQLGSTQYLAQNYVAAAQTFEQYLEGSRNSPRRQQAGYWAALSHQRAGREPDARSRLDDVYGEDPLTFYGVFAGELIEAPVLSSDIPSGPPSVPGLGAEFDNALLRLRVHRLVPTNGSFSYELDRLTEHFSRRSAGTYDFADALIAGGFPLQAIVIGRRLRAEEGHWNLRLLRIVHPFPHREIIVREAAERGLDPFFVAGLIRQESAFDAGIESSAGAVGLMQLMPPTAREVATGLGLTYSRDALADPETNLRLGITYLASMVRRFEGKPEDVLSAYNAGPGRMRGWQEQSEYRDRDVFLEHIPFQETRNYVKVVQQYARIYSALYGCGSFSACLGMPYSALVAQSPLAGGAPRTTLTRD